MTLYLLCGMSFAGKSTLAAAIAAHTGAAVVSLDAINHERGLAGGLGIPASEWARSHRIALERTGDLLARGSSVVVDDTNCFRFLRDDFRALAAGHRVEAVLLHLDTPEADLHERRDRNEVAPTRGRVLDHVFADLHRQFERPGSDERPTLVPAGVDYPAWVSAHLPSSPRGPNVG